MHKFAHSRRLIALLAAYVLALQALLLPLSIAAGAAFDGNLCAAAVSAKAGHQPAGHDTGCPCAAGCGMQCCAQVLGPPPPSEPALGQTRVSTLVLTLFLQTDVRPVYRGPQIARAPPSA